MTRTELLNYTEIVETIKEEYVNDENLDILLEVIGDTEPYTEKLSNYCIHENDDYFFDSYFERYTPSAIISALVSGEYYSSDEYVRIDGFHGYIETLSTREVLELIEDNIEEIVEVLADLLADEEDIFIVSDDRLNSLLLAYNE